MRLQLFKWELVIRRRNSVRVIDAASAQQSKANIEEAKRIADDLVAAAIRSKMEIRRQESQSFSGCPPSMYVKSGHFILREKPIDKS